jgi:predicted nucleic acid-binding protein
MAVVADTSALVSIAIADVLGAVLDEYDVHTARLVVEELEETAAHDDVHGAAASDAITAREEFTVHDVTAPDLGTSRIDAGEASCLRLCRRLDCEFLLTDDLRALPELQACTDARVAISPILLRALVKRDVLTDSEAESRLEAVATSRDWLGAPIYRRARRLFER